MVFTFRYILLGIFSQIFLETRALGISVYLLSSNLYLNVYLTKAKPNSFCIRVGGKLFCIHDCEKVDPLSVNMNNQGMYRSQILDYS